METKAALTAETHFLTPPEAAHYLRLSVKTLAKWRSQGGGPAFIRAGRKILYRLSDLNAFLQRQTATWAESQSLSDIEDAGLRLREAN